MYTFGGFNSLLLGDILKYTPKRCEAFANETACMQAGPGVRCVWAASPPGCIPWENATLEQQQKILEDCPPRPGMCHLLAISLFPFLKMSSILLFSWFSFLLAGCHYQISFQMGTVVLFPCMPGDPFLWPNACSNVEIFPPPSPCSYLLLGYFFLNYCTACTYFPIPRRCHQWEIRPGPWLCRCLL